MSDAAPADAKPKAKKGKLKLIIIAAVVLAVGIGGGVYAMRRPAAAGAPVVESTTPRGLVTFDPFVVNLADPGGTRFLRVTLQVVVDDEKVASKIMEETVEVKEARSVILELLAEQSAPGLVTPEGKAAVKKTIVERVGKIFKDAKVTDVFFSEFVVQF